MLKLNFSFQALQKEAEIAAEDDQVFLLKMQTQLNQQAQAAGNVSLNMILFNFQSLNDEILQTCNESFYLINFNHLILSNYIS